MKILAASVWYIGGIVLMAKGTHLLWDAESLIPGQIWPWLALITGLLFGTLKAKFLFCKICRKNLVRIDGLEQPKLWQFYRLRFFVFLIMMIATGITLSRLAQGNYPFLLSVAILDYSIAVALIGSSYVFWRQSASNYR